MLLFGRAPHSSSVGSQTSAIWSVNERRSGCWGGQQSVYCSRCLPNPLQQHLGGRARWKPWGDGKRWHIRKLWQLKGQSFYAFLYSLLVVMAFDLFSNFHSVPKIPRKRRRGDERLKDFCCCRKWRLCETIIISSSFLQVPCSKEKLLFFFLETAPRANPAPVWEI